MNRSHVVAYLLMAASLGFLGGSLFERGRAPKPGPAPSAGTPAPAPAPEPVSKDAKMRARDAIAAEDWKAAVASLKEMLKDGEPVHGDALALLFAIIGVEDIVEYTLREEALAPLKDEVAFHKYGLAHAREVDDFAAELYVPLACEWLGAAGEWAFLFESLAGVSEGDEVTVVRALEGHATAEMLPALGERARKAGNISIQAMYLRVIASAGEASVKTLRELAASSDRLLAEGAAVALQMVHPPVSGFLVLNVAARDGERGNGRPQMLGLVRRGDIVTKVGAVKIDSEKAWREVTNRNPPKGPVEVELVRKGEKVKVTVPMNVTAPKGRFVEAAKN